MAVEILELYRSHFLTESLPCIYKWTITALPAYFMGRATPVTNQWLTAGVDAAVDVAETAGQGFGLLYADLRAVRAAS